MATQTHWKNSWRKNILSLTVFGNNWSDETDYREAKMLRIFSSRLWIVTLLFVFYFLIGTSASVISKVKLQNNAYSGLVIAINPGIPDNPALLESIKVSPWKQNSLPKNIRTENPHSKLLVSFLIYEFSDFRNRC